MITQNSNSIQRSDARYHNERGLAYKRERHFDEAVVEFEQSLALNPDDSFALANLAHIYLIRNDLRQAQHLVERARKANPNNWFACGLQGDILARSGDLAGASSAYEEQLALKSDAIYAYINLGIVYRKQGRRDAALSILTRGLEVAPDTPKLYNALGDVYAALRQYEQAQAQYQRAIELNSEDQYAFNRWVACQIKQQGPEAAVEQLRQVLKIPSRQKNAHLHALLGLQLKKLKRYEEAIAAMQKAVQLNPQSIYFRIQLAFCYSKNSEYPKVLELLEPIYNIRSKDALVAAAMVKAYLHLNKHEKAQTVLKEAMEHQPDSPYLRMMAAELRRSSDQ